MDRTVDLAAVNRVAKRVELKGVRLAAITATCDPNAPGPSLGATVGLDCQLGDHTDSTLEVVCDYTFVAQAAASEAVKSTIRYLLLYEISGAESANADDLAEFARANGALHSWPFVRELLYGLTSRMGFPPYTLPVLHFNTTNPPPKIKKTSPPADQVEADAPETTE